MTNANSKEKSRARHLYSYGFRVYRALADLRVRGGGDHVAALRSAAKAAGALSAYDMSRVLDGYGMAAACEEEDEKFRRTA